MHKGIECLGITEYQATENDVTFLSFWPGSNPRIWSLLNRLWFEYFIGFFYLPFELFRHCAFFLFLMVL